MALFTVGEAHQEAPQHSVVGCVTELPGLRSAQPLGHITYPFGLNFLIYKMGMTTVTPGRAVVSSKCSDISAVRRLVPRM